MAAEFRLAWLELDAPFRRSLELAYAVLAAGGLGVGAVLTDEGGRAVAEGRNRAWDPPGGDDPLQGTPLAHAEMNALGRVRTGADLSRFTLWSTQEPCSMCAGSAAFAGVGAVRWLAPDPWAPPPRPSVAVGDEWAVAGNVLFLLAVVSGNGPPAPPLAFEPETSAVVAQLGEARAWTAGRTVEDALAGLWPRVREAAAARRVRVSAASGAGARPSP